MMCLYIGARLSFHIHTRTTTLQSSPHRDHRYTHYDSEMPTAIPTTMKAVVVEPVRNDANSTSNMIDRAH